MKSRDAAFVMPGLVPGIHVLAVSKRKTWMAGTSPAMTAVFGLPNRNALPRRDGLRALHFQPIYLR
jgi:hypothetical protein